MVLFACYKNFKRLLKFLEHSRSLKAGINLKKSLKSAVSPSDKSPSLPVATSPFNIITKTNLTFF